MPNIPFFGLTRQYSNHREEILDAVNTVYSGGQVLDGPHVEKFEEQIAGRCHREFAVAVNSCTQGLILAQQALGIKNQQVIIPTVSFAATVNSVTMSDNVPVYCDVDQHGMLDLETLAYNPRDRQIDALMYVNLFGNVIDYDRMRVITEFFNNDELTVIEDAAQSFGAYYKGIPSGKLGHISVLSFDPTKNLPNYGSGGMILTDDWATFQTLRNLRDNGKEDGHVSHGTNSKMSEADCAGMLVKLKYFDAWQRRRTEIAEFYVDNLKNHVRVTSVSDDVEHAWHKFPIWFEDTHSKHGPVVLPARHHIKTLLHSMGIDTRIHYATPLHELATNPHSTFMNGARQFPYGDLHARTELSLPIYPELTDLEVEYVVESVIDCISSESIG